MRVLSYMPFCPYEGRPGEPVVFIRSVQVHDPIYAQMTTAILDAQARTIFASHRVV
jgi:hypothetical protein